jgi:tetratricopeptide (TPR) repeat protein
MSLSQTRRIADYTAALRIDPNDAFVYYLRGIAYWDQKNYRNARADHEKALQIDPNNTTARDNLEKLRNMRYLGQQSKKGGKKMTEKLENTIRLFEKDLAKILKKVKQEQGR